LQENKDIKTKREQNKENYEYELKQKYLSDVVDDIHIYIADNFGSNFYKDENFEFNKKMIDNKFGSYIINHNIVTNATVEDLKKMWNESKHIGEFYEKLKAPPFCVTDDVLKEFEGFIKDNGIDIYQSFLDGVHQISDVNMNEFDNKWDDFIKEGEKLKNREEEKHS